MAKLTLGHKYFNLQPGMQNFHPSINTLWGQIIQVQIAWATDRHVSDPSRLTSQHKPGTPPQAVPPIPLPWQLRFRERLMIFALCRALAIQFCWSQRQCCASRTENVGRRVERKPNDSTAIQQSSRVVCLPASLYLSSGTPGTLQSKSLRYQNTLAHHQSG